MSAESLSHAERLAQRLIEGDGDEAAYQELRFEAMAMAHAWHSDWLAEELVATFDKAAHDARSRTETAAIVLGLLRGARLARTHGPAASKTPAWANPALTAALITTLGMVLAAMINQYGATKAASTAKASTAPAVVKPNIQIVLPSAVTHPGTTTIIQQAPPDSTGHAAATPKPVQTASAAPAAKASAAPAAAPVEPLDTTTETAPNN